MKRTVGFSIASFCCLLILFTIGCGNTDNLLTPTDDLTSNSIEAVDGTHQLTLSIPGVKDAAKDADLQKNDSGNGVEAQEDAQQAVPAAPDPPPDPCPACRPPEPPA